ncbi:MAG: L,D-transpeptidase [Proteobacteria bacterium]|nr:L,D-transpeptidase [Pseudomonadota bacterium]
MRSHTPPITATATAIVAVAFAAGVLAAASAGAAAPSDPGILLELDRERFALRVRDLRSGETGPAVPVVLGSPAHPTPGGSFALERVILNPAWTPGPRARAGGALDRGPGLESPMGVAKIPFAGGGAIALHGGGDPLLLGKPVSSGCVRAADADLLRVLAWLHERGALAPPEPHRGESHRSFQRRTQLIVY